MFVTLSLIPLFHFFGLLLQEGDGGVEVTVTRRIDFQQRLLFLILLEIFKAYLLGFIFLLLSFPVDYIEDELHEGHNSVKSCNGPQKFMSYRFKIHVNVDVPIENKLNNPYESVVMD